MEANPKKVIRTKDWGIDLALWLDQAAEKVGGSAWRQRRLGRFSIVSTLEHPYVYHGTKDYSRYVELDKEVPYSVESIEFEGRFYHSYSQLGYEPFAEYTISSNIQDTVTIEDVPQSLKEIIDTYLIDEYESSLEEYLEDEDTTFARRVSTDFKLTATPMDAKGKRLVVEKLHTSQAVNYIIHNEEFSDDYDYMADSACIFFEHGEFNDYEDYTVETIGDGRIVHAPFVDMQHTEHLDLAEKILAEEAFRDMTWWLSKRTSGGVPYPKQARRIVNILRRLPILKP